MFYERDFPRDTGASPAANGNCADIVVGIAVAGEPWNVNVVSCGDLEEKKSGIMCFRSLRK